VPVDVDHVYREEILDEDMLSSRYREDPAAIAGELYDAALNVEYDGARAPPRIAACSLRRLVVEFAVGDLAEAAEELELVCLALQSITSAPHFLEHWVALFELDVDDARARAARPPPDDVAPADRIVHNLVNFVRKWILYPLTAATLRRISAFLARVAADRRAAVGNVAGTIRGIRLMVKEIMDDRLVQRKKFPDCPPVVLPADPAILFRPNLTLLDPDPTEVARQISLRYHEKFAAIPPHEFMTGLAARRTTLRTPLLADFFEFGDLLSLKIAEVFLIAENKRDAFARIFAMTHELYELHNVDGVVALVRVLNRADVEKIGRATKEEIAALEAFWQLCGEDRGGRKLYEDMITQQSTDKQPGIPNMHAELKLGDMSMRTAPDFVRGLINWKKLRPWAKRCQILRRFQLRPFKFTPIPQIQNLVLKKAEMSAAVMETKLDELSKTMAPG
jgi:hypothetical protein